MTHWVTAICALTLLVTGTEIVISHPRFYWGENGNVLTPALFSFPIPSSRSTVPTGYGYVLPDQNGWSRYLHFQAAWALVLTGALYLIHGLLTGHFRAWSYGRVQRLTYLAVIFLMFPLIIWTGLAMSPAFTGAIPASVTVFGGRQTARTLHFFLTVSLIAFVIGHVVMVWMAGFKDRVTAMITGRPSKDGRQESAV